MSATYLNQAIVAKKTDFLVIIFKLRKLYHLIYDLYSLLFKITSQIKNLAIRLYATDITAFVPYYNNY